MITHSTAHTDRAVDEVEDVEPSNYDIDPPDFDGGDSWGGSGDPPPIQVNFSRLDDLELIQDLQHRHGYRSGQDVVRNALAFFAWVSDHEEQGAELQLRSRNGSVQSYALDRPSPRTRRTRRTRQRPS